MTAQPRILAPLSKRSRYLTFNLVPDVDPRGALTKLAKEVALDDLVVGLGRSLVQRVGGQLDGLRESPVLSAAAAAIPSTPAALWLWLSDDEAGTLHHRGRSLEQRLSEAFRVESVTDGFLHDGGRDLTGYEDGTENPTGDAARDAAFLASAGAGLDDSSFVAVQRWQHNLDRFQALSQTEQDHSIGRRRSDNVELEDAPASAHVKRTAQESFDPNAFVLRRSVPWVDGPEAGLMFVAFGKSFDAFEALLKRMVGLDDGIADALFRFTRPLTSGYFWCPPTRGGQLDLSALGL